VIPTFFDLRTGKTAKGFDMSVYWWTEGNGSCDCNRAAAFGEELVQEFEERIHREHPELHEGASLCYGCMRFIAIDVEGDLNSYDYDGNDPQPNTKEEVLVAMNYEYADYLERAHA
jgi:hypothetical protein